MVSKGRIVFVSYFIIFFRARNAIFYMERFHVLIDTIKQSQTYPPPRLAKTEDVPEELKKYLKDFDSWGEA